jgi:peptide-methionine (S)-S-oxide reductase
MGDHSEALQIEFNPETISFSTLLDIFWESHNPLSRSWSRQYQAGLFTHSAEQARIAQQSLIRLSAEMKRPVMTKIVQAGTFYPAEGYHQKYRLRQNKGLYKELSQIYPQEADLLRSTAAARVNGYLAGHGTVENLKKDLPDLGLTEKSQQILLTRLGG